MRQSGDSTTVINRLLIVVTGKGVSLFLEVVGTIIISLSVV